VNDETVRDTAPTAPLLQVEDLHVSVDGAPILRGVNLTVQSGQVHAIMGPNGSGKSTLAKVLLGNPAYVVTSGTVRLRGEDVTT
jgi:Fe-S cluster assembly ATP-binding protein